MSKSKRVLILPLVFVVAIIVSFLIRSPFQQMVRWFYRVFAHNKIFFYGKWNRFLPSDWFILSFGVFCVLFTALLFRYSFRQGLYRALLMLALFFASVAALSCVNGQRYIAGCTGCWKRNGQWAMGRGQINYDAVFIAGLSIALLPMLTAEIIKWFGKKEKSSRAGYTVSAQR